MSLAPTPTTTLGHELAQAARDEGLGWQRRGPLLAGLLFFATTAAWLRGEPGWALSLGLWVGHAASDGLCGALARRWRTDRPELLPPLLLGALLLGTLLGWAVEQAVTATPFTPEARVTRAWLHFAFGAVMLAWPLLLGLRRLRAVRRVEQERARLRAELQMLQAQIEPHFLFNTLATLRSFVRQGSAQALPMLDAVSGLLETSLDRVRQTDGTTLGQELQVVSHYLAILQLRLGERLRWRIDADPALHALPLPPLMLQPLVENAFQHGVEPWEQGGEIELQARRAGRQLQLVVRNTGQPLSDGPPTGHGLALANLRQRLQALHGDAAGLTLARDAQGATLATLTLPLP